MESTLRHILFLSSWYPSEIFPSNGDFVQRHALATAEYIKVSNIHVVTDPSQRDNLRIEKSKQGSLTTYIVYCKAYSNPVRKYRAFQQAYKKVYQALEKIDIVHVNVTFPAGTFALYLKRKYDIPYIVTEHWTGYHAPKNKSIGLMQKVLTKRICKNAFRICPVSNQLANSMKEFGLEGKYKSIPNIVDTDLFVPSTTDSKCTDKSLKVLHVSNMKDEHKNVSGILNVIGRLQHEGKNVALTLVGGDPSIFDDKISALSLKSVILKPQVTQKELAQSYQAADVFVLFSHYENLPCVILEAFSCGLPVISSNVGGISEYFPRDFGRLVPKADEEALYQQLCDFHDNSSMPNAEKMHQYSVDNFSKKNVVKSYMDLYSQML